MGDEPAPARRERPSFFARVIVFVLSVLFGVAVIPILLFVLMPVYGVVEAVGTMRGWARERAFRRSMRLTGRALSPEQVEERVGVRGGTLIFEERWGFERARLWWTPEAVGPVPRRPRVPDKPTDGGAEGRSRAELQADWDAYMAAHDRLDEEWADQLRPLCRRYLDPHGGSAFLVDTPTPARVAGRLRRRLRHVAVVRVNSGCVRSVDSARERSASMVTRGREHRST